jgi:CHASE2 domain-containing sensor protein
LCYYFVFLRRINLLLENLYQLFLRLILVRYLFRLLMYVLSPLLWVKKRIMVFLRPYWQRLSHFQQHFVSNLLVGILIALMLVWGHNYPWLSRFEDAAMDTMMQINQNSSRMNMANLQFAVLDIDETTYHSWGEPFYTPRDKLLDLLNFAVKTQASLIVLDIDLNGVGHVPSADQALADFLFAYSAENPPLLLLRNFYPPNTTQIRPLFFDASQVGEGVIWAHPLFKRDADHILRRWYLLRVGCAANQVMLLPSFQLVTDALWSERQDELQKALAAATPASCEDKTPLDFDYQGFNSHSYGVGERIIYSQSWPPKTPEILHIPALSAIQCVAAPENCDMSQLQGRAIIIGASHRASHDYHYTPLGEMPGMMVIINAIKSFHLYGQTSTPPNWVKWLIEAILIILMAWAFARFNSMLGALISGIIIVLVLVPISFYFFKFGVWVDFALPIVGMQLHQMVAKYLEEVHLRQKLEQVLARPAALPCHKISPPIQVELPLSDPPAPKEQICLPLSESDKENCQ